MNLFKKGNFSETPDLAKLNEPDPNNLEEIKDGKSIPDGIYTGILYGYTFETKDGIRYRMELGSRKSRPVAIREGYKNYKIKDGKVCTFSGFAEAGGILGGMSYGPKDPSLLTNPTRIKLDEDGFKIPKNMNNKFNMEDRAFAIYDNSGKFTSTPPPPIIGISKDNSVIRKSDRSNKFTNETSSSQPNKMTDISLEWNKDRTFHLAVEPWITTPLMSDTEDGIYIGSLKGNNFDTGKKVISLAIKLDMDYPESVVALIKNQKAYLFKASQLTANTGSKLFSKVRQFADSNESVNPSNQSQQPPQQSQPESTQSTQDQAQPQPTQSGKEPIKPNRSKKGESKAKFKLDDDDESTDQNNPIESEQPEFKTEPVKLDEDKNKEVQYKFDYQVSEPVFEVDAIIGTTLMSVSFAHLFHLCTTDYSAHMALDEYYKSMPEKVDNLAENYLATSQVANFQNCLVPKSLDPVEYFEQLQEYVSKFQKDKLSDAPKFSSLIDDILQLIGRTLYKLKRLKSGRKLFSDSGQSKYINKIKFRNRDRQINSIKDTLVDSILAYFKKFRKSPIKELKTKDEKVVRQYVNNNVIDDESAISLLATVLSSMSDGINDILQSKLTTK